MSNPGPTRHTQLGPSSLRALAPLFSSASDPSRGGPERFADSETAVARISNRRDLSTDCAATQHVRYAHAGTTQLADMSRKRLHDTPAIQSLDRGLTIRDPLGEIVASVGISSAACAAAEVRKTARAITASLAS